MVKSTLLPMVVEQVWSLKLTWDIPVPLILVLMALLLPLLYQESDLDIVVKPPRKNRGSVKNASRNISDRIRQQQPLHRLLLPLFLHILLSFLLLPLLLSQPHPQSGFFHLFPNQELLPSVLLYLLCLSLPLPHLQGSGCVVFFCFFHERSNIDRFR